MTHAETIEQVATWLRQARSAVAFTGAGISTESGIPDFRSPGGVWAKNTPVYFDEFLRSAAARHEYWRQKSESHRDFASAKPNVGHLTLAAWERSGRLRGVVTQNIDGLHQDAGCQKVLELHGTARQIMCLDCLERFDAGPLVAEFRAANEVPLCEKCGGKLKHATVSFGQSLPEDVLTRAIEWCREADVMLAMGSSLVVTPAAELPKLTKQSGGRVVIINRDPTPLDGMADAVINAEIGETLTAIQRVMPNSQDAGADAG